MLHIFRKTYFDDPIHVFGVLYLTKPIFGFHVKNIDISCICILDSIHIQYASNVFQYHIFVFIQVWGNRISISKFGFRKIRFLFKAKYFISQK